MSEQWYCPNCGPDVEASNGSDHNYATKDFYCKCGQQVQKEIPAFILSMQERIKALGELLRVAQCPNCDGSGAYPRVCGDGEVEPVQCQWCFERQAAGYGVGNE